MQETRPGAVVVLGMHRSGTSLTMNALYEMGVDLGPGLVEEDEWNPGGYWEIEGIWRTHEAILERLDRPWEDARGLLPFPADWWRSAEVAPLKHELSEIARKGVASAVCAWGFKDPRAASLLPLWQEVFDHLAVDPTYVLVVRHPRAVADSLAARNGFVEPQAQLLWLRCYLDAVRHAQGRITAVIEYERWFSDPAAQVATLTSTLGRPESELPGATERVLDLVKPELCHHTYGGDEGLDPPVAELYGHLQAAAAGTASLDDRDTIDRLHEVATGLCTSWAASAAANFGDAKFGDVYQKGVSGTG